MTPMDKCDKCPFCGSTQIFGGEIKSSERFRFHPYQTKTTLWTLISNPGIEFGPSAVLCVECGMLWARVGRQAARDFFEAYGNKAAREKLKEATDDPPSGYTPPPRLPRL